MGRIDPGTVMWERMLYLAGMKRFGFALILGAAWLSTSGFAHSNELKPNAVRGIIRAEASAVISSELVARVATIPVRAGQSFKVDDVLLTFDCQRYEADLRGATAEVKTQEITVDTNRQLLKYRAAGTSELALAEAKLAQAKAAEDSLRVRMSQCVIKAPYNGRLVERKVDIFEMPQPNTPLLKIVKEGGLEVDVIVPSQWATRLKGGDTFDFTVDETNTTHTVRLTYLGAVVDPVSRTIKATGKLIDPPTMLRPGMSGTGNIAVNAKSPG